MLGFAKVFLLSRSCVSDQLLSIADFLSIGFALCMVSCVSHVARLILQSFRRAVALFFCLTEVISSIRILMMVATVQN